MDEQISTWAPFILTSEQRSSAHPRPRFTVFIHYFVRRGSLTDRPSSEIMKCLEIRNLTKWQKPSPLLPCSLRRFVNEGFLESTAKIAIEEPWRLGHKARNNVSQGYHSRQSSRLIDDVNAVQILACQSFDHLA